MQAQTSSGPSLPDIREISCADPLRWLAGGWADFQKALLPCLAYGGVLAIVSLGFVFAILYSGAASWVMVFLGGFIFVAPMIAMGLYEAGRKLETGQTPDLMQMLFVKTAAKRDLAYLGLALLVIYFFWTRMAQLVYALAMSNVFGVHKTVPEILEFMLTTEAGWNMAATGTIVGAVIGLIAFSLIVVSAPMLLDRRADVFVATVTSVRSVAKNPVPMILWAVIIAVLTSLGLATLGLGLIIIFPVIGLASWRAYRALVVSSDRTG